MRQACGVGRDLPLMRAPAGRPEPTACARCAAVSCREIAVRPRVRGAGRAEAGVEGGLMPVLCAMLYMGWVVVGAESNAETRAGGTIMEFEESLVRMRMEHYRHPKVDILNEGFRPVGGRVADFAVAEKDRRYHFFYIERRLEEATPFYPGHEIYFGHASTANFFDWEVHDPVLLIRPGTWEEAHVWAPCILKRGDEYVMAYTGVNRHISQDIGLAFSRDLYEWRRWEGNPISPCSGRPWASWRPDAISSCRDPDLYEHAGRVWMTYTANTREGATCVALASSTDLKTWTDHGPVIAGPTTGYVPNLAGGHPQGSMESARTFHKRGRWFLTFKWASRGSRIRCWLVPSDRNDRFDLASGWEFWPGAAGIEVVREEGDRSLLAAFAGGFIRFGVVDWSAERPTARFVETRQELEAWSR